MTKLLPVLAAINNIYLSHDSKSRDKPMGISLIPIMQWCVSNVMDVMW